VNFRADDEIRLVLTQADRAIAQYKPLLDQEQQVLGKEGAAAVAKDREVLAGLELAIKGIRKHSTALLGSLSLNGWTMPAEMPCFVLAAGAQATQKCAEILKQKGTSPKQ
jgi:hypothetical protein